MDYLIVKVAVFDLSDQEFQTTEPCYSCAESRAAANGSDVTHCRRQDLLIAVAPTERGTQAIDAAAAHTAFAARTVEPAGVAADAGDGG